MHACWYLLVKWYLHDSTRVSRWRRWLRASSPCCTLPEVLLFFTKIVSGIIKNSWIKCRFLHFTNQKGVVSWVSVTFPQRSGFAIANPIHLPQLQVYTPNIADCLKLESPFFKANSGREGLFLSAFQAVDAQHDLYHWEDSALRVFRALTPLKNMPFGGISFFHKKTSWLFAGDGVFHAKPSFFHHGFFQVFHVASSLEISGFASSSAGSSTTKVGCLHEGCNL